MRTYTDTMDDGTQTSIVYAPFDVGLKYLEEIGEEVISSEQNALLRIQQGTAHDVSRNGNWVREGVLYVPGKGKFLTKNSPIMQNPPTATNAHRNETDFYLTERQVEYALEDSVLLSLREIPTNRFGDDEITSYAFGKGAKQYGEFLWEVGINSMHINTAAIKEKPFARQLWFRGLDCGFELEGDYRASELFGHYRALYVGDWLRGIKTSAEGIHQEDLRKIKIPYEPLRAIKTPVSRLPPVPSFDDMKDSDFEAFLRYNDVGGKLRWV